MRKFLWWSIGTIGFCYAIYNPTGLSLTAFVLDADAPLAARLLVAVVMAGVAVMYVRETWRSLGAIGLMVFCSISVLTIWLLYDAGVVRNASSFLWWGQIAIGFKLAIGLQGGRIYQWMTGRVPVAVGGEPT